jgi:hypothetical protein
MVPCSILTVSWQNVGILGFRCYVRIFFGLEALLKIPYLIDEIIELYEGHFIGDFYAQGE